MSDIRLLIRHVKRGEKKLDLSSKVLTEIPSEVYGLTNLETLVASDNKITNIDKIGSLHNLKELDLSKNFITTLPEDLLNLDCLEKLRLEGCPVATKNPDLASI
jgi:leucine-rich repeat protein SHOC2